VACQSAKKEGEDIISGAVHRSPGIYLTAEENLGKSQLKDRLMKAVQYNIVKWNPFPSNKNGRITQHVMKAEKRKGRGMNHISWTSSLSLAMSQTLIIVE
jgi:hypothetical protein